MSLKLSDRLCITPVKSDEVRTSRWTPRQRSSWTTGGTSGSTSMSLKLSDETLEELVCVKYGQRWSQFKFKSSQVS